MSCVARASVLFAKFCPARYTAEMNGVFASGML